MNDNSLSKLRTAKQLLSENLGEFRVIVGVGAELPLLPEGLCMLTAPPKNGKSWFCMALCNAVANGSDFLGYKTNKCDVLYYDLESADKLQQKRLNKILDSMGYISDGFYITDNAPTMINSEFEKELEERLKDNPNIGLVVVDVFQKIRPPKMKGEDDYQATYRDLDILLKISHKHHISIVLVHHSKKNFDPDNPFDAVLGSVALQGKPDEIIVIVKDKVSSETSKLFARGRTIDGLVELDIAMNNSIWNIAKPLSAEETMKADYMGSEIRLGVLALLERYQDEWEGKCKYFVDDCLGLDDPIAITQELVYVGRFFNKYKACFLKYDNIKLKITENGTGSKIYSFTKSTIDKEWTTIDEIPFDA